MIARRPGFDPLREILGIIPRAPAHRKLVLPDTAPLTAEFRPDLLNGVEVVKGQAESLRHADAHKHLAREQVDFTAIPYYAWANRGRGEMAVWLARDESAARPLPFPTIASTSKA